MWKVILGALQFVVMIVARILKKRAKLKTAEEILGDTSPTADAVSDAEAKARAKFGEDKTITTILATLDSVRLRDDLPEEPRFPKA